MNFKIRDFAKCDAEYQAIADVQTAVWPDYPATAEELEHWDDHWEKEYLYQRLVVEVDGTIVGYGNYNEPSWSYQPNKYEIGLDLKPEFREKGIGSAFYDHVMSILAPMEPAKIVAATRENQPQSIRFLENRGFAFKMRFPTSHLDLQKFDPSRFEESIQRTKNAGIEILTLPEIKARNEDWKQRVYDLRSEIQKDVPAVDPITPDPIEVWETRVLQHPNILPECWVIALDGDQYVGYSNIWKMPANSEKLDTGLTGVLRSHRRKGVCTAMKIKSIETAKKLGAKVLETENEENNPMYQINLKLGFEPQPAWLDFHKIIEPGKNGSGSEPCGI